MAASRLAFALGDLIGEVRDLRADAKIEVRLDPESFAAIERELVHHFGGRLQDATRADDGMRGVGRAVMFGGIRLAAVLPGDRWGL